jgi:hypothetical protein
MQQWRDGWICHGRSKDRKLDRRSICVRCLRSLERHAADDGGFRLLSEDGGLAFLGLVETVELADPCVVFDGSKSVVGQSEGTSLDVLEQMLGDRLLWVVQDFDGNNGGGGVLDAEAAERLGDLLSEVSCILGI